jgi:hypothetical protein
MNIYKIISFVASLLLFTTVIVFAVQIKEEPVKPILVLCEKDTCESITVEYTIFDIVDKYCKKYDVPEKMVYQIGMNESGWPKPDNLDYLIKVPDCGYDSYGDLQIWSPTRKAIFKELNLIEINRENCIHASIYYLYKQYVRYGSWYKARFAYGRGSWRGPSTWKPIEKKFMNKHNWKKYDEQIQIN